MKKIIVFAVFLFAAFQMSAQEFHFIPKVGLNLSNLTKVEGNVKPGVTAGIAGEIRFNKDFALETGIFYATQGCKVSDEYKDEDNYVFYSEDYTLNMQYLNIPLLAKGYLVGGFHVFAGPQFGFNLSSTAKLKDTYYNLKEEKEDVDMMFKSFSLDLTMGMGYQTNIGLLVSAQYNLGLTNILEDDFVPLVGKTRNSVFQINVGWRF